MVTLPCFRRGNLWHSIANTRQEHRYGIRPVRLAQKGDRSRGRSAWQASPRRHHLYAIHKAAVLERIVHVYVLNILSDELLTTVLSGVSRTLAVQHPTH
jgi:hypothetical protein